MTGTRFQRSVERAESGAPEQAGPAENLKSRAGERVRVFPNLPMARSTILIIVLALVAGIARGQETGEPAKEQADWTKPQAALQAEVGIDSLQRRFFQPRFSFDWPLAVLGGSRAVLDVRYLQRINGSQEGTIDFWILAGLETRISDTVSFEGSLDHFCRHLTSVLNPYVLNLNELIGRLWLRREDVELGLGFGPYVGGSRGYNDVMVLDFHLPRFLIPELSLETEWKWTNFRDIYYEAGLSIGLTRGTDLFIRATRDYAYPATAYIGLRFRSAGAVDRILEKFDLETGLYPYFDVHKLLVSGGFRLEFLQATDRRFFVDIDFRTPILSGNGLLGTFWPDHMLYDIAAQYDRALPGGLFGGLYTRYSVDMPVDKPLRFRSGLAVGLALGNQADFNRLDKPLRFDVAAGYDFVFAYDVRIRLGAQVKPRGFVPLGADFRLDADNLQQSAEFKVFAALGKDFEVRPFVGIRQITYLVGAPPAELFKNRLTAGFAFLKWF